MNDKPCESCPLLVHRWTYREIIPAVGVLGLAVVMLVMMHVRLGILVDHELNDEEMESQRWKKLLSEKLVTNPAEVKAEVQEVKAELQEIRKFIEAHKKEFDE